MSEFGARLSADGHIMVQQTIPFSACDAMWHKNPSDRGYYRMLVRGGHDQLVTINSFDELVENVIYDAA